MYRDKWFLKGLMRAFSALSMGGEENSPNYNTHLGLMHGLGYGKASKNTYKKPIVQVLICIYAKVRDTFSPHSLATKSKAIEPSKDVEEP